MSDLMMFKLSDFYHIVTEKMFDDLLVVTGVVFNGSSVRAIFKNTPGIPRGSWLAVSSDFIDYDDMFFPASSAVYSNDFKIAVSSPGQLSLDLGL